MAKKLGKLNSFIAVSAVAILLSVTLVPLALATNVDRIQGFDKGPSYKSVVPMKKTTFVNFDEESYLDDYAYLAAVPTAVFDDGNKLFSNPLLFYQDEYPVEDDKERSLNARQGLDYFMEDWMSYCNGQLDQMTLINVPKNKLDSTWKAKDYTLIEGTDPYTIASDLALSEWSYADSAVIAVIDETFEKPNILTEGEVSGSIPAYTIGHKQFEVEQPVVGTGGTYKSFQITDEHYKYVVAELSWPNRMDLDLQLYDNKLGMVDNAAGSYSDPQVEVVGSYIHNYGDWQISVSAVPKKGMYATMNEDPQDGGLFKGTAIKELVRTVKNVGNVDVLLYPGTVVDIASTPFGCSDIDFTLSWSDPNTHLGFTVLDPVGTEICSSLTKEEIKSGEVNTEEKNEVSVGVGMLGECREGENYSICVFSLDDISISTEFTLDYSWQQNFTREESECFVSATNGAVLASALNAPLLYVSPSELAETTKDVLYKLGVEDIYLVNIGDHLSKQISDEINAIAPIKEAYQEPKQIYDAIRDITGDNDIIFTTIDSWTYWYVAEMKPAGEYPAALFVGPAAYIAAQHGSPVLIVDQHPRLSQAIAYHTDFWNKHANQRVFFEPAAGSMVLSGMQVYDFLEEYDFGKIEEGGSAEQIKETIITVAGQYDIGTPWDRVFTGAAYPGRFFGSPVDTAYWISRNVFYPQLIFQNPAATETVKRINGSESTIQRIGGRLKEPKGINLVITKPSQEEEFQYPVLMTFNTYGYKFNEKASKHWDFKYTRADGIVPYVTDSLDPIDDGAAGKPGAYYPDMSESEVVPFYASRAGYDNVFSTSFDAVVENLNRGVLIWNEGCHGYNTNGGMISLWDPDNPYNYEPNPWRAYEPILLNPGNLRELFRFTIYLLSGPSRLTEGLVKFHLLGEVGSTENPDVAHINPQFTRFHGLLGKLGIPGVVNIWGAFGIMVYRDRILHPLKSLAKGLPLVNIHQGDGKVTISPMSGHQTMKWYTGIEFDDALENLHSCGLNTKSCMPALTYMHLAWMRHGIVYQIIDPWTTTDWAGVWEQMMFKRFAMGDTIGEAYERGMRACGPEFLVGQWWWDKWENVELFGDPDLRVLVPGTDYSSENYWQKEDTTSLRYDAELDIDGHMPFGATGYPHEKEPLPFWLEYLTVIIIIIAFVILLLVGVVIRKKK